MEIAYPQLAPREAGLAYYKRGSVVACLAAPRRPMLVIEGSDGSPDKHLVCLTDNVIVKPTDGAVFYEYRATLQLEMP